MFTGIIETIGSVYQVETIKGNKVFTIQTAALTPEIKIDQSVAHNGVCLTVIDIDTNSSTYKVEAITETLGLTTLDAWKIGDRINLERAARIGDRLDGHIVQGHVDTTATCVQRVEDDGSWKFYFRFDPQYAPYLIPKGSVTIDGVSLTILHDLEIAKFGVAIIPYTYEHTGLGDLDPGKQVNLEFDIFGKYFDRYRQVLAAAQS